MTAVTYALLAIVATRAGDHITASRHLDAAHQHSRTTARRERQLVEIAALIVSDDRTRARGLSFEHIAEFPADTELLESLLRDAGEMHES